MTELAVAYLAFIGVIGADVYRWLSRLADVDSRLAAAENALSSDENE